MTYPEALIIEKALQQARERWPGEKLDYCGVCTSWEQCLQICAEDRVAYLFYNIGKDTRAEEVRL